MKPEELTIEEFKERVLAEFSKEVQSYLLLSNELQFIVNEHGNAVAVYKKLELLMNSYVFILTDNRSEASIVTQEYELEEIAPFFAELVTKGVSKKKINSLAEFKDYVLSHFTEDEQAYLILSNFIKFGRYGGGRVSATINNKDDNNIASRLLTDIVFGYDFKKDKVVEYDSILYIYKGFIHPDRSIEGELDKVLPKFIKIVKKQIKGK